MRYFVLFSEKQLLFSEGFESFRSCNDCLDMKIAWAGSEFFEAMEAASVLHILILVYLRLIAIRTPLSRDNRIIHLRKRLIILIWTISFSVKILGFLFGYFWIPLAYKVADIFQLFFLGVVPLISIIVMNCLIIRTLKTESRENKTSDLIISNKSFAISNYNSASKVVRILVYFLIFSITPYLLVHSFILKTGAICVYSSCDIGKQKVIAFKILYNPVIDVRFSCKLISYIVQSRNFI